MAHAGCRRHEGDRRPGRRDRLRRLHTVPTHELNIIPGLFQTRAYASAVTAFWRQFLNAPDDVADAVELKLARAARTLVPTNRIAVVLGAEALQYRYTGSPADHAEQLAHLLRVSRLPFVSLGIVPLSSAVRTGSATTGFWIFDEAVVRIETPTAAIKVTRPTEIQLHLRLFAHQQGRAVHGAAARRMIAAALADA
ncbi:hypothetical protein GCM10010123_27790 [Pilimelia anulata]|uniref:DUF5753 domain-containing protein n=1 Tax=Pilimelia anulata TaxID=53371 RepID=A0A8J3FA43_9ACTN|nr:Scr1 family TA system antitoxin-like transcriptional regulator [Pilimelia anulata]GGJ96268.1 hypothetical protein GCM10010123_27790 [Pilimelia anulata]